MKRPESTSRDSLWVWAQNILTLAVLVLGPVCHSQWQSLSGRVAGAVLFLIGAFFGLAGVRALGANRTPRPTPLQDARLVEHGIYGVVRHPLYTSLCLLSSGWSLLWQSWSALAATAALALLLDAKARLEERLMRQKFAEYDGYASRVRRLIPGVY